MIIGKYPDLRMRRLRSNSWIRDLTQENILTINDLVWPIFVRDGKEPREEIKSLPGIYRENSKNLVDQIKYAKSLGIKAVALFPVIEDSKKTYDGAHAIEENNLPCRLIKIVKDAVPEMGVIIDVALDPFTTHGHDGILIDGKIDNDRTLEMLALQARLYAASGADIVAPSDMMDGRVGKIRQILDQCGFSEVMILSYSAKYASSLYAPFRDALGSKKSLGLMDKNTYQMNIANSREALREVALDIKEGADLLMVKPAISCLDIISEIKNKFSYPVCAYQVSGEYSMIFAAEKLGIFSDGLQVCHEQILSIKRAGADIIFTYAAPRIAEMILR